MRQMRGSGGVLGLMLSAWLLGGCGGEEGPPASQGPGPTAPRSNRVMALTSTPNGQFLWWDDEGSQTMATFGANSTIEINFGKISYLSACPSGGTPDFIYPYADVYIVPSGSVSQGDELEDVSGEPNTVIAATSGMFMYETIGYTSPSGQIGPGTYAVVFDECQDGKVTPADAIFDPAFTVLEIPADVPPLPDIALTKALAGVAKEELEKFHEWLEGWFEAATEADVANPLSKMLWGMGTKVPLFADPRAVALTHAANAAKRYAGIEADPPDPQFRQLTLLEGREVIDPQSSAPVVIHTAEVGSALSTEQALAEALLHALERYQGAELANDGDWALLQARAVELYALRLAAQVGETSAAYSRLAEALSADTTPVDHNLGVLRPFLERVRTSGFNADELREARNLGLSEAELAQLRTKLSELDFTDLSKAHLLETLSRLRSNNTELTAELTALASRMRDVITALENDPGVRNKAPRPSAGGPYTGRAGTALTVSASASTSPSPITQYAWDLDGDGAFDDATGATASFTYDRAFKGLIGVQVTNAENLSDISYAAIDISRGNGAPVMTAASPSSDALSVEVGTGQQFSVTGSDPDGDPLSTTWYVQSASTATSAVFTYSPGAQDLGFKVVDVHLSDDAALGGTVRRRWSVAVLMPDGDGDGWRSNVDCADADASVHPGQFEFIGNGKDDDCDLATSDSGSPPSADFLFIPAKGVAGEAMQFTDASTDADGFIASWAWDFDGDGTVDSTEQNPTHTFQTSGSFVVSLLVTDAQGNTATATRTLQVRQPPTPAFTFTPTQLVAGTPIQFTDGSTDDGSLTSWSWQFGDGASSTQRHPVHTYTAHGPYTVSLTVTDDEGISRTKSTQVSVLGRPEAVFSSSSGLNVARLLDGATIAGVSSVYANSTSYRPENAIDSSTNTYWLTGNGQPNNQWVTVRLVNGGSYVIDRVVLQGQGTQSTGLKDFQLRVSRTGTAPGDFTTVLSGRLPQDLKPHTFTFSPVEAQYVQLVVLNNWGSTSYTQISQFEVLTREHQGGIVSLLEGPPASIVRVSSEYGSNYLAAYMIDSSSGTMWASANGRNTNQSAVVQLGGGKTYTINAVALLGPNNSEGLKDFEIRVSNTTSEDSAFQTVVSGTRLNNSNLQRFTFAPVQAKYVQLLAKNNHGSSCCIDVSTLQVLTPDGANVARAEGVGAFVVDVSSQSSASNSPEQAIDFSASGDWRTEYGKVTGEHFTVRLLDGTSHLVDRILLQANGWTESVKDFEIRVSDATTAEADFQTVVTGTLPRDAAPRWVSFPAVRAKYVQFVALNNHGSTSYIQLTQFQVYTPQLGGRVASFEDFSSSPNGEITSWQWDFGDGTTATGRYPTHTYAAPGTYLVRLTVTDSSGVSGTMTMQYTALQPRTPSFTWAPQAPNEGQGVAFTNTTPNPDGMIKAWRWSFSHDSWEPTSQNTSITFPDNGTYAVTLSAMDLNLFTTSVTWQLTVANVAPTVNAGPDRRWAGGRPLSFTPSISDSGTGDTRTCSWDFGDGSAPSSSCPFSHTYPSIDIGQPARTYTATLTVTDDDGASSSDSVVITSTSPGYVTLQTAPGDGQVIIDVGAFGDFGYQLLPESVASPGQGDARYDPLGPTGLKSTSWESALHLRRPGVLTSYLSSGLVGASSPQGALTDPGFTQATATSAESSFTVGGLRFELKQTVSDLRTGTQRTGSLLTQVYTITNLLEATRDFELVRYYEGDLAFGFGAAIPDGGGRLVKHGTEIVFQTDKAGAPATAVDFVGITAVGGVIPTTGRYEVNRWSAFPERIRQGLPLGDVVFGDGPDEDTFVDSGLDYDVGVALANRFPGLAPGQTVAYVTTTIFGSGAPDQVSLNEAPVAMNQALTTDEDTARTVTLTATDVNGDALSYTVVSGPAHGTLSGSGANLTYTPEQNYYGPDSFTFKAHDGFLDSNLATVSLTVQPVNDPPRVFVGGPYAVAEGGATLLAADGDDLEGDALTYAWDLNGDGTFEQEGQQVTFSATDVDGPALQMRSVRVTDSGGASSFTQVVITVANSAPSAELSNGGPVIEGSSVQVTLSGATDPSSADRSAGLRYAFACDGGPLEEATYATSGTSASTACTFDDGPSVHTVRARVLDKDGAHAEYLTSVEVLNAAPTAVFELPEEVDEGSTFTLALNNAWDSSLPDVWAGLLYAFDCGEGAGLGGFSPSNQVSCTVETHGPRLVRGVVQDKDGGRTLYSATLVANSVPPVVGAPVVTPELSTEGEAVTLSATFSSRVATSGPFTCTVDYGDGSALVTGTVSGTSCTGPSHTYVDNGAYTVSVTLTNRFGAAGSSSSLHTVQNVAPVVESFLTPKEPTPVHTVIDVQARFSDRGTLDTHTAVWDWGDGTTTSGTVDETAGSGTVSGSHGYPSAGVYRVKLTVTDKDGGVGQALSSYVVIYDDGAGFVTGGGWIQSPEGAYPADPTLTGRANFGFVAKYQKGATTPTGQTEFQFRVADLNFHSRSYEWLVVSGARAQYKGVGTINGSGEYGFLLTAVDGQRTGGGGVDRFRIKLWDTATGNIVYDNQLGTPDDGAPDTALSGGAIVIHTSR